MIKELHYSDGVFLLDMRTKTCLTPRSTHSYMQTIDHIDGSRVHVYECADATLEIFNIAKENVKHSCRGEKARQFLDACTAMRGYFTRIGEFDFFRFERAFDFERKGHYRVVNVHTDEVIYRNTEGGMLTASRLHEDLRKGLQLQGIFHPFALYAKTTANGLRLYVCLNNDTSGLLFLTY